jgi:hypothetical protein
MGRTTIRMDLSLSGIRNAQQAVIQYRNQLHDRLIRFVDRLADYGIDMARVEMAVPNGSDEGKDNNYSMYIAFSKDISDFGLGVRCILVATNTGIIQSRWVMSDGSVRTADVSPLLMLEFGAGTIAGNSNASRYGMGTRTFPGQTHADDPEGWWYQDADTMRWYHSKGYVARMPIQKAADEMIRQVRRAMREVFG